MLGKRPALAIVVVAVVATAGLLIAKEQGVGRPESETNTVGLASGKPIRDVTKQPFSDTPPVPTRVASASPEIDAPQAAAMDAFAAIDPLDGLVVTQQRLRRGGMGSKALTTFTLVNKNDFAVKDVAMRCEFAGRDGRFITARNVKLADTMKPKSRKRYGPTLIGFVNVTLQQGRCGLVTASRA